MEENRDKKIRYIRGYELIARTYYRCASDEMGRMSRTAMNTT